MSSSLDLTTMQLQDAFPTIEEVEVVPGIVFVATPQGVSLLHPESLQPLALNGLTTKAIAGGGSEARKWYQFWGNGLFLTLLHIYDVGAAKQTLQSGSGSDDFGSGVVVFAVNGQLVVLHVISG